MTGQHSSTHGWGRLASVLLLLVVLAQQLGGLESLLDSLLQAHPCAAGEDCHPDGGQHPGECDASCDCAGCPSHQWVGFPPLRLACLAHPPSEPMCWLENRQNRIRGATRPPFRPPSV